MKHNNVLVDSLMERFETWWESDAHKTNMNFYDKTINKEYLSSLSDNEFKDFFFKFVSVGGYVQSGGSRSKNLFREMLGQNLKSFRKFILLPFEENFSLEIWFSQIKDYPYFGVGIATIYLNRVNKNKYSIMNNKTLNALNKLGYPVGSTKNWETYLAIYHIQKELLRTYKNLRNFYKVDALNHFVIAVDSGHEFVSKFQDLSKKAFDELELEELSSEIDREEDKSLLLAKIIKNSKSEVEFIKVEGVRYKRYNYVMNLIKQYRGFECQFCKITIPNKNGGFYIETCHIKSKSTKGHDSLENILTLCPNCHKIFDLNDRLDEKHTKELYQVTINNKKYRVKLT